ncbi:HIRAN domain-containing protein [Trueperella pyogenes]|uniref:HIRAN domain-containing protein n=1 Tax=Trueperella pyogenes TaxID=1661 RepID=UPI00345DCC7C
MKYVIIGLIALGFIITYPKTSLGIIAILGGTIWLYSRYERNKTSSSKSPVTTEIAPIATSHFSGPTTDVIVVGTEYYEGASRLTQGRTYTLTLKREPHNKHDANAIAVLHQRVQIGYLSRFQAKRYRDLVDYAGGTMDVQGSKMGDKVYVILPAEVDSPSFVDTSFSDRNLGYSPVMTPGESTELWTPRSTQIEVVGEAYRNDSYREIFRGVREFKHAEGAELEAQLTLIPDPDNPHDRMAVGVWYKNYLLGYLSRDEAKEYHHTIAALEPAGKLSVKGRIWSRNDGNRVRSRTYFFMPDFDALPMLGTAPDADSDLVLPLGKKIQVIGEEHHMEVLADRMKDIDHERAMWLRLRTSVDFRPKSARERVDVFLDDDRIGWLSDVQSKNMLPLVKLAEGQGKDAVVHGAVSGSILKAEAVLYVSKAGEVSNQWIKDHAPEKPARKKRPEFMWDDDE